MSIPLFSVKDKIVLITGGTGKLGTQFAKVLHDHGAKVAVLDIACEATVENADNMLSINTDITKKQDIENALRIIEETWGTPHALINNAALDSPPDAPPEETGPFETYPEKSWDMVMEVNTKGVFLCCQIVGSRMASKGRGSIVNISSIYGMVSPDQRIYEYKQKQQGSPFIKPIAYSVSKSALFNFTRYLATYWAKNNVRVNTLTFAGVFNNHDGEFLKNYCAKVPLGRMAREDEYNGAIIFLVSDSSSYMTGSNMVIDGGWTAW